MKSGKKIIVAIIIVLILLLMVGCAFAYMYIATDIFRTDKELFLTYFAQITSEDGFVDKRIQEFSDKKKQVAYENSGEIATQVQYPDESMSHIIEKVNELAIRFSGKVDSVNQKVEQNIQVDYGNDVILPINYRQDANKFGVQTDELAPKFIAVRNQDLQQFAANLGVEDVSEIPDVIEFSNTTEGISFTDEEIESLKQTYGTVLEQNLLDENFASIKNEDNESYTLELSNEQIKNIIIKMLEATKQNTLLIDKVNEIMLKQDSEAEKIDASVIDDLIESLNEEDISNMPNLKITLVQNNKQLKQIIIEFGETKIEIEKSNDADSLSYNISCEIVETIDTSETSSIFEEEVSEPEQVNVYFNMQYTGLDTLTEVKENCEFGFNYVAEQTMAYDYEINCNTQFVDSVSIEELDENAAVFLNDYNEEQVTNFLTQVGNRFVAVNKSQMTELGLEEYENPLLYSNPVIMLVMSFNNLENNIIEDTSLSDYEIQQFNSKFESYTGESLSGSEVNALISTVENHNLLNGDYGINVIITLDGVETLEKVELGNTYKVEAIYDTTGLITEIQVTSNN